MEHKHGKATKNVKREKQTAFPFYSFQDPQKKHRRPTDERRHSPLENQRGYVLVRGAYIVMLLVVVAMTSCIMNLP